MNRSEYKLMEHAGKKKHKLYNYIIFYNFYIFLILLPWELFKILFLHRLYEVHGCSCPQARYMGHARVTTRTWPKLFQPCLLVCSNFLLHWQIFLANTWTFQNRLSIMCWKIIAKNSMNFPNEAYLLKKVLHRRSYHSTVPLHFATDIILVF